MRKPNVETEIYAVLRKRVHDGVYPIGGHLPNQRDLAAEFRTSPTTISKALGRLKKIGLIEMTQGRGTRVLPLDERPSAGAVAVVKFGDILSHQEPARIYRGITETLSSNSQHHKFVNGAFLAALAKKPEAFAANFAGAVFVESCGLEKLLFKLDELRFPCVVANLEENIELTSTFVDHGKTTETAVRFLAAMGHENIAIVTNPVDRLFYAEAIEGFKRGLKTSGLRFDLKNMLISEDGQQLGAYQAVKAFLETSNSKDVTAYVACRDYLAYGAYEALKEKGVEIGRDVSVVGFDNITWPEKDSPLTTFEEPAEEMGRVAAKMLMERMISDLIPMERREVPSPLIIRLTAGPPRAPRVSPPLNLWTHSP